MKLLHLSDLHIGRRIYGFSLLEDQRRALADIAALAGEHQVDAVLLAGDVYDKAVPSEAAVAVLDDFLTALQSLGAAVFLIAGNHDSAERLQFGSRILERNGLYIAGAFTGKAPCVRLMDAYGPVDVYLLPYLRPAEVRPYFEDIDIVTHEDAVRAALSTVEHDPAARSVLLAHQFVTAAGREPLRSESETISVGGLDNVDASAFDGFDYVALGHLHGPQSIGRDTLRYAGSPLKYSFSESRQQKGVTIIELGETGCTPRFVPLAPLHDLRELRGPMQALIAHADNENREDYLHILLTDGDEVPDAMNRLREIYPNVMHLSYDNARARAAYAPIDAAPAQELSPLEQFAAFFALQNGRELDEAGRSLIGELLEGKQEPQQGVVA